MWYVVASRWLRKKGSITNTHTHTHTHTQRDIRYGNMAIEESEILNGCKQDYGGPHGISQFSLTAAIRPEK